MEIQLFLLDTLTVDGGMGVALDLFVHIYHPFLKNVLMVLSLHFMIMLFVVILQTPISQVNSVRIDLQIMPIQTNARKQYDYFRFFPKSIIDIIYFHKT